MKVLFLGVIALSAAGQEAPAQLASAPTPTLAAPAISYHDALECATSYQLHAGEAEMQGLRDARKARFASSDKAAERAQTLGVSGGKTASAVDDDLMARMDRANARPPSRAALASAARRCDSLLALTTP